MFFDFKKKVKIKYKVSEGCENFISKKLNSDNWMDLCSSETVVIPARSVQLIHTGVYVDIPEGYNMEISIRPEICFNNWIGLANGIEVIDSNSEKEITVLVVNYGLYGYTVKKGDKLLQAFVHKVPETFLIEDKT